MLVVSLLIEINQEEVVNYTTNSTTMTDTVPRVS